MDNRYKSNTHLVYEHFYGSNRINKPYQGDFESDFNDSIKEAEKQDKEEMSLRKQADEECFRLHNKIMNEQKNIKIFDFIARDSQEKTNSLMNLCNRKDKDYDDYD